jgi:hypothetical protein
MEETMDASNPKMRDRIQARHIRDRLIARNGRNSYLAHLLEQMTDEEVLEQARLHHVESLQFARESSNAN